MAVETNTHLIRRLVEEVSNAGRTELIAELFLPGSFLAGAFANKMKELRTGFPDLRMTIEEMVAEADDVVIVYSAQGTNTGPFMGQPPSGKPVVWTGIHLYRIKDAAGVLVLMSASAASAHHRATRVEGSFSMTVLAARRAHRRSASAPTGR